MSIEKRRKAAVRGLFYPQTCRRVEAFFQNWEQTPLTIDPPSDTAAILVPHAGYLYSGSIANLAYHCVKNHSIKRVIVIGPSHHYYFKGISGSFYETFETPCGDIEIDSPYLFALAQRFHVGFIPQAHEKEHSTEVQMPFIRHYFPKSKVIELIYGDIEVSFLTLLILALVSNKENLVVISSDLSHYHSLKIAQSHDKICIAAIEHIDPKMLSQGCEACGITGIKALLYAAQKTKLTSKRVAYGTSATAEGNTQRVVGYLSALFYPTE